MLNIFNFKTEKEQQCLQFKDDSEKKEEMILIKSKENKDLKSIVENMKREVTDSRHKCLTLEGQINILTDKILAAEEERKTIDKHYNSKLGAKSAQFRQCQVERNKFEVKCYNLQKRHYDMEKHIGKLDTEYKKKEQVWKQQIEELVSSPIGKIVISMMLN